MSSRLYGDWKDAGIFFNNMKTTLFPLATARLKQNGDLVLKELVKHIENQDLNWTPLKESTIRLKNGDDTIYVETGFLKGNLKVRKVKSSRFTTSYFIGATPWQVHPSSGEKFSDIMIMLEYGTKNMPPRPLVRPTWNELEDVVKSDWNKLLKDIIRK